MCALAVHPPISPCAKRAPSNTPPAPHPLVGHRACTDSTPALARAPANTFGAQCAHSAHPPYLTHRSRRISSARQHLCATNAHARTNCHGPCRVRISHQEPGNTIIERPRGRHARCPDLIESPDQREVRVMSRHSRGCAEYGQGGRRDASTREANSSTRG